MFADQPIKRGPAIDSPSPSIAYFITPHGYGHAARASAVMQALQQIISAVHFELFTEAPEWFFKSSLDSGYTYHSFASDVGLVQAGPFDEDLTATVQKLKWLRSTEKGRLDFAARILEERKVSLVLCDIAPSGIQAARQCGIPSVLIENFTWDFIYDGYRDREPELQAIGQQLAEIFRQADHHIQTRPVCRSGEYALTVEPVSRRPKASRGQIRSRLQLSESEKVVLVTQGGIETQLRGIEALKAFSDLRFILPGAAERVAWDANLVRLPHHSDFYTPDLVYASDAVIGKLGYGTVAEVYQAGLPFGYIPRASFPETPPMTDFVRAEMQAIELPYADFSDGNWGDLPYRLLELPRVQRSGRNGADQIAEFVRSLVSR